MRIKAYDGKEPYIFVSYSHKNSDKVLCLIEILQRQGFYIWYDEGIEVGTEWPEYIADHIYGCSCMLIFMSPEYANSNNCKQELNYAQEENKECIVVYLKEPQDYMTRGLKMKLGLNQAIYYGRHSSDEDFLEALMRSNLLTKCRGEKEIDIEKVSSETEKKELPADFNEQRGNVKTEDIAPSTEENSVVPDTRSEEQEHIEVLYRQGEMHNADKDYIKAAECYTQAAEAGHADAQYKLGILYLNGRGVVADKVQTVEWFARAAEQGHIEATKALNMPVYRKLLKLRAEEKRAAQREMKILVPLIEEAEQGSGYAMYELGELYEQGDKVKQDYAKAMEWYQKAAACTDGWSARDALYRIGLMYQSGRGVAVDNLKVAEYFVRAVELGHEGAKRALNMPAYRNLVSLIDRKKNS